MEPRGCLAPLDRTFPPLPARIPAANTDITWTLGMNYAPMNLKVGDSVSSWQWSR